ncbi:uncharacterized protein LOC129910036 [Episyrphus balteatus]|uniref:uncharacterized protein LOC129910036 n=1 Tax=Episyrphus balteatus TaxID=286459 RepID=UPI002486419B|nr:uncharacterized protein LOC129910036 [Episyrphus balteatus]
MFLNRNDVLDQLIELYNCLDLCNSQNLMDDKKVRELHCPILRSFLFNEIEDFTKTIIEDVLEIERFDFEFANKLYEFDKLMFEKKIKSAIKKYFKTFKFNGILRTVSSLKYDLQAVMGYEGIFEQIYDISNDNKESYELSRKLQEMIAKPLFTQMTIEKRSRLIKMAKCLPIYPHDLSGNTKVLITNIGNKCHLNMEMVRQDQSPVIFPTLTFDMNEFNWIIHYDKNENFYEIESPNGQVLCWVKPLPSFFKRILPPEAILMDKTEAKNTKWNIQYLEEEDPSKGFTIKAAEQDIYISAARTGEFSTFVSVVKELDLEQRERFAWKFQSTEY